MLEICAPDDKFARKTKERISSQATTKTPDRGEEALNCWRLAVCLRRIRRHTDSSGFWDDPANWITDTNQQRFLTSGDTVTIDRVQRTRLLRSCDQQAATIFSTEAILISSVHCAVTAARFRARWGLAGGNLQAETPIRWFSQEQRRCNRESSIGGGTFSNSGDICHGRSERKTASTRFANTATGVFQQSGDGTLTLGGTFTNQAGGLFDFLSDGDVIGNGRFRQRRNRQEVGRDGHQFLRADCGSGLLFLSSCRERG